MMAERMSVLYGPDNGRYYYDERDRDAFCPRCKTRLKPVRADRRRLTVRKYDWSYTYDNQLIITRKAKTFLEERGVSGAEFVSVNRSDENFALNSVEVLAFDLSRASVRFIDKCTLCDGYAEVIGPYPAFVKDCPSDTDGLAIYRSDIEFGSHDATGPLILVGERLKAMLAQEFRELHFEPVTCTE